MSNDALARSLARSPELFPHSLDANSGLVGFVRLTPSDYLAASFLDDRVLSPAMMRRLVAWSEVECAAGAAGLEETCHFIFHIGHVGSTLLSRLLGGQKGAFALREPAILRTLAQREATSAWGRDDLERRIAVFLKLWSRTFVPQDRAVIKATSFVSEMAAELLSRRARPKAVLMFVSPESYLATILGGANAPQEAKILAPYRLKRLERRLNGSPGRLEQLGLGEMVAMGWASEMTALGAAKAAAGERAHLLDFDAFLLSPAAGLLAVLHHLDIAASDADVLSLVNGPDMRRYAKAPEFAYDADLRRAVLDEARSRSGDEIKCGRAWLEAQARTHPAIADALNLQATAR